MVVVSCLKPFMSCYKSLVSLYKVIGGGTVMDRLLLVTGNDRVGIVDPKEGKIVDCFISPTIEGGLSTLVYDGTWSPDGGRIAIGMGEEVSIRNLDSLYEEVERISGYKRPYSHKESRARMGRHRRV